MKKPFCILLFAVLLITAISAAETVNLTEFPDASTIISSPRVDGLTYPAERPNGIYGTKAQITPDIVSTSALTNAEKADLADISYGVSAIGINSFGNANALRNLVDGKWDATASKLCDMTFDNNKYDVDGTVNANGKYRALITLNFSTEHRFDACGFISAAQEDIANAADIYVSSDGVTWTLVPTASWDASNGETLIDLATDTVKVPADTWTNYVKAPFATLFDMNGVSGQYIRIGVISGRTGSSSANTINAREFIVYGEQTGEDNPLSRTDILFIGNSFTFYSDMPENIFEPIARASGYNVYATRITCGGYILYQYADINDQYGAQVHEALKNNKYDYVVIQGGSSTPIKNPESFYVAVRRLVKMIRDNGATPILYCTWGHKEGSETLASLTGYNTTEKMTYGMAAAYKAIGDELGVSISQVGLAFWKVHSKYSSTINLYDADYHHPSSIGSYLIAMTHFANILGGNPLNSDYNGNVKASTADILKQAAYDATYNTPSIPAAYLTSSVGVGGNGFYGVDASKTVVLTEYPKAPMISVQYKNGKYSAIKGDKGAIASEEYATDGLTDEQKADIANIGYGVSMIGIETMYESSSGYTKAVRNLVNGHWGTSLMVRLDFDDKMYDIDGTENENGKYRALFTLNFGSKFQFDAIGFFSGDYIGFPAVVDVYVSDDGENWTIVPSACYDAINHTSYVNLGPTPKDPNYGNTAPYAALFGMSGVTGKYVRLGIMVGRPNTYGNNNTINTRELVVYGRPYPLGDVDANGEATIADAISALKNFVNDGAYYTSMDLDGDGKTTLFDVIRILNACSK